MDKWNSRLALYLIFPLLGLGCAQVGSPGGGETDEAPPLVVNADPVFGQTEFSGSTLRLTFDEFVKLKDARRQVLVSPPLSEPPRLLVKGRSVIVDLGEDLMPDRTYVVQFGEAVLDLRESNVAAGLTHVFATGSALDSGRVEGRVLDAWTGLPLSGSRVLLFADSLPNGATDLTMPDSLRPLPDYVGLVLDSGEFEIGFLPEGKFSVLALDDENGNYRADPGEALAWLESSIASLGRDTVASTAILRMDASPKEAITYVSGSRVDSSGFWRAKIEGLKDWMAGPDGPFESELGLQLLGPDSSAVLHLEGDSVWSELPAFGEEQVSGTWQIVHPAGMDSLVFREVESPTSPALVESVRGKLDAAKGLSLRVAPPADLLDTALCSGEWVFEGDTGRVERAQFFIEGSRLRVAPLRVGARYQLELEPGALVRRGVGNRDTLRLAFSAMGENATGSILLTLDSSVMDMEGVMHVLTDAAGQPLYSQPLDRDGRFSDLPAGNYGLMRIYDVDGNGRWSGANPIERQHPERAEVVATDVVVRAGWEVELTSGLLPRP